MEENKLSLESIENKIQQVRMDEEVAGMAYPQKSSDYYYIYTKCGEIINDLRKLKEIQKDDNLSKIIDNKIEDVKKIMHEAEDMAQEINRHESFYGPRGADL